MTSKQKKTHNTYDEEPEDAMFGDKAAQGIGSLAVVEHSFESGDADKGEPV